MKNRFRYITVLLLLSFCLTSCALFRPDSLRPTENGSMQTETEQTLGTEQGAGAEQDPEAGHGSGAEQTPGTKQDAWTEQNPETEHSSGAGQIPGTELDPEAEQKLSELRTSFMEGLPAWADEEYAGFFADWLLQSYEPEELETVNFSEDISGQLYDLTGKSLHVLWDTALGLLDNSETAAAHFIYLKDTEDDVVRISFAGDICLTEDGYVIDHYDELGGDIHLCISDEIMDRLNEADISMLNHEYPVSTRGTALKGKYYTFRALPEREAILQQMGIDLVSLANNHIYDYGADAFYDTLDALKQAGIPYVGAGADMEEAKRPVYFVTGGIKIGFVSANRSEKIIYTPEAGENSPGVVRMYDTAMMNDIIREASGQCDYLIAYVHWGKEDSKYYQDYQTDIAKEFFASGADLIIGSHPHVLQGIGYVEDKPVLYSLGDFWFNKETKYTTVASLEITIDGLQKLSLLPCRQEGYETHYLSEEAEQKKFYDYVRGLSPEADINDAGVVTEK